MEPLRNILKIRRKSAPSIGGATSTESDESQRQIKGYLKIQDGHSKMFGKRYSATSAELDASQCKFSGYLKIQGKRRYVIVSEGCLNVYLNENAKNLKKSYPICAFERVTPYDRVTPYENDYTFKLTFREANRPPIVCSCKSSQNRTEWVRQIDTAISFGGESGFESSEMLQHKTPDIHTTISKGNDDFHPGYSTVNQSKLYKAKQDATGTEEDPSYFRTTLVKDNEHLDLFYSTVDESRLYKTKHNVTGTSENPSSESEGLF
ncbi:uncharacterized protein LOC132757297 [Ruditapes philippinarum]|uniref:uncharacterized protein LOC132757297 n=1 Tax=Ruditapes philippinarum TaxID=129788 RepID=UPI00295ACF88|nr:uncharacterized protein LOC132757297 [Ruditapes philippinarum]